MKAVTEESLKESYTLPTFTANRLTSSKIPHQPYSLTLGRRYKAHASIFPFPVLPLSVLQSRCQSDCEYGWKSIRQAERSWEMDNTGASSKLYVELLTQILILVFTSAMRRWLMCQWRWWIMFLYASRFFPESKLEVPACHVIRLQTSFIVA